MTNRDLSIEDRVQRFQAAAREAGIKLTHQRLEIFREIAGSQEHPDAEAVYQSVRRRMPTVARDTVYRTLWKLQELGLITTLGARRQTVRFDANLDPHHHYVCNRCGLTRDFESVDFNALRVPQIVSELGSVAETHVEVRGLCRECQREEATRPEQKSRPPKGRRRRTT
ncbi:MAG: Fur family transcriptional regulator [Candidatus Eisenbacteria bacterium]